MDAEEALAHLTDVSPQVDQVALVDAGDLVAASTFERPERAERFVAGARRLLDAANGLGGERAVAQVAQLEAATLTGSVFVVREGERLIVATTRPDPTVGLVFYDLKHALRSAGGSGTDPDEADEEELGTA